MLQLIIGFFLLCAALALLGKIVPLALKIAAGLAGIALAVVVGVPVAIGMGIELCARRANCGALAGRILAGAAGLVAAGVAISGYGWVAGLGIDSVKFLIPALLPVFVMVLHERRLGAEREGLEISLPAEKTDHTYQLLFSAIAIWLFPVVVQAAFPALVTLIFSRSATVWWFDLAYCIAGCLAMGLAMVFEKGYVDVIRGIKTAVAANRKALDLTATIRALHKESSQVDAGDVEAIVLGVANAAKNAGQVELFELCGDIWLFDKACHDTSLAQYRGALEQELRHDSESAKQRLGGYLPVPQAQAVDYFERYLDFVEECDFDDGPYMVTHLRKEELNCCNSCGLVRSSEGVRNDEWYCSPICEETEKVCTTIQDKPLSAFLADASSTGFLVIEMGGAWSQNHKMVADGGQGHGFAAENANNMHDRLTGKSARVIGGDNAKNGADRLVNGQEIQTKYCKTGARSVGAAFDNKGDGGYRYFDAKGKPMPIEVPRDQYDQAVKTMERKIEDGKVPGVTDPAQAKNLVLKGHLTYDQAKNITRFGTFDSIRYDMQEGAIVSLSAGGISFAVTATISYLNTNDRKQALQAACIQGGKTFGKTLVVYVGTQQLHRLATVQAAVKYIEVGKMSKPMAEALQRSMGVSSRNQLNHALRGTVVASLVIVAVSSGPDLLKMVRGRMSGAQFTKNLAVTASSTAGGAAGAIAGGAIGASFGPVGIWVGKLAGGFIGGAIAGTVTNAIAKSMMKEDGERMLEIVQRQVEYLAVLFMLTEREVESLSANLNNVITAKSLEAMYGSSSHKAFANLLVKPIVAGIVKQRPVLRYDVNDVVESFDGKPLIAEAANDERAGKAAA
ncbi:hypothetical protein [Cupriavidus pauculus]|uniref:Inner membrane protein yeeR n=1 Tax=Cupriavidus pauculus TaxID=82633 RepID=A0A2N5C6S9_9BURK|nr:hypothetical protein [Cupriavidus pauculus]PLP97908.1 hypothetical protein CYJ10_24200 [Cupriavidus pauculus]